MQVYSFIYMYIYIYIYNTVIFSNIPFTFANTIIFIYISRFLKIDCSKILQTFVNKRYVPMMLWYRSGEKQNNPLISWNVKYMIITNS